MNSMMHNVSYGFYIHVVSKQHDEVCGEKTSLGVCNKARHKSGCYKPHVLAAGLKLESKIQEIILYSAMHILASKVQRCSLISLCSSPAVFPHIQIQDF